MKQLRDGIRMRDSLSWHDVAGVGRDGRSDVDTNKRSDLIASMRQQLNSHDGVLSRMAMLKGQTETSLKESSPQ